MPKVLVLTSSTGGGHDLRAAAIQQWAEQHSDLGISVEIYRPLEKSGWHYGIGVDLYKLIQTRFPGFHHVYWNVLEVLKPFKDKNKLFGVEHYRELLRKLRPEVVVSVHPQLNHGFFDLTREVLGEEAVRCVTYCGELAGGYGFSPQWVNPAADLFIGANDDCCAEARRLGMPEDRVFCGGFMLRPASYRKAFTEEERASFLKETCQFVPDKFTLLMATGALGAHNHLDLLDQMDRAALEVQVIALCGKDPSNLEKVSAWKGKNGTVRLCALGYTSQMFELMGSASAVVTRGGTGTTSECILTGCPPITNCIGGTMPQECITIQFLGKQGLLKRMDRPADIVPMLKEWLEREGALENHRQRLGRALPPGSPRQVLEKLVSLPGPAAD